ncbi:hypothetical protein TNCV_2873471 [Trichonephila clavipes]|nr:hypothetical protein TNCV_2873471 [Trichonephila clavipes]
MVGACGVNNQASAVLASNELPFVAFRPPAVLTGEGIKLPCVFEAVREIYRNILATASFEKVDRFRSEIQLAGHPLRGLMVVAISSQVKYAVKKGW